MASVPTMKPPASTPSRHVNNGRESDCALASSGAMLTAVSSAASISLHLDFTGVFEVGKKHFLSRAAEGGIFDHRIELVVDRDAQGIEIGRAYTHPASVDDARLRVHHLTLPFP